MRLPRGGCDPIKVKEHGLHEPMCESAARYTLRAVPTKAFREALMSHYRRLKIEGEAFFYKLALADRGSDLLIRFGE